MLGLGSMMMMQASTNENLPPAVMRRLVKELKAMKRSPPDGIELVIGEELSQVTADITGPEATPFEGGVFRVLLKLTCEFPAAPPAGFFLTNIFHPNVRPETGEICLNILKKDWKPDLGLRDVLLTIKSLMIFPNPESALNETAGKLMLEAFDEYASRARLMTSIHATPAAARGDSLAASKSQPVAAAEAAAGSVTTASTTLTDATNAPASTAPPSKIATKTAAAPKGVSKKKAKAGGKKKRGLKRL
ncbi:ubiquitin carrier protein [Thecamonas trahens ATCC 50062]|uniref:E2 ubiquitin-conjugating enzyme n=1 Tax=Thecamonas trahens ATCC 50062 TaxID=461836 RepID=A0A0L0D8Q5_THETB|nr:ubiquitin carrier protein [Thecamonas trahens ATCC 50062]KNC48762.1 ubiquitin carrier protein [Thecamonas trahens ATCC 50062]|eukprot:XP_013762813.1 ubiquitin carrier protein [Thecamonas trahens ATCC 50062]